MPNTHVPAAGEAMPAAEVTPIIGRFSRRALLGAIASLPAVAGATAAFALPTVSAHPDAELLRLGAEMELLQVRSDEIGQELGQIVDMAEEAAGPRPLHPSDWKYPSSPDEIRKMDSAALKKMMAGDNDVVLPKPAREWHRAAREAKAGVQTAWDAYDKRHNEHERLLGVHAKEDEDLECSKSMWELGQRIFTMPADTLQGMAVKLRASDMLGLDDFPNNEGFASIAADIRRLAGGAGATAVETVDDRIRRLSGDLNEAMDEWAQAPGSNAEGARLWLARSKS